MKKVILLTLLISFCATTFSKNYTLQSPDKRLEVTVILNNDITYSVRYDGIEHIVPSRIAVTLNDGMVLGKLPALKKVTYKQANNTITPLYGISDEIAEEYNELQLEFKNNYVLLFRAYNEGIAWRFQTDIRNEIVVKSEQAEFTFAQNYKVFFHPILSEAEYRLQSVSDASIQPNYSSMPVLVKSDKDVNILIHESDVLDYPCMTLKSSELKPNTLLGEHAQIPSQVEPGGHMNFNLEVKKTEDIIAKTTGKKNFPWRIIAFEKNDKDILNNQLVYLLASENKLTNTAWIKPGKVAWDWWNGMNLTGVPFKTGHNTDTYKYFIDFAARNGIEYVNLDEGWSDQFDLLKVNQKLNLKEIVDYAQECGVGIFLWCVWWTLDKQMIQALDMFENLGIAGIKVDFMDRDDQIVVNFHERLLRESAKRHILVNFHGAYHPTGMQRTYPNCINVEGVRGLEWNKFNEKGASPDQAVIIPFIRMFAGGMDYTPGAMQNYNREEWKQITERPMSQGTRCQQLAMYVVYYAPLQMISDSPTAYEKEPEFLKFLASVPVSWNQTVPLQSKVGEYVNIARRKGEEWFVAGMTNWEGREQTIKFDFVDKDKSYLAEIVVDGVNADRIGSDYSMYKKELKLNDTLHVKMAPGGGYAVKLSEKKSKQTDSFQASAPIIMFGNSLIEMGGNWNQRLGRTDIINSGRGGFTTSHFVWLLNEQVIDKKPKLCFLEGGINDLGVGIPLDRIKQNYLDMVDRLMKNQIKVVLMAVLHTNFGTETNREIERISEINAFIKQLAETNNLAYFDLNPLLAANQILKKEYTTDGVHLTDDAYRIWSNELIKLLNTYL